MMIDATYQRAVTKELEAQKAAYIHRIKSGQTNEPERSDTDGRK